MMRSLIAGIIFIVFSAEAVASPSLVQVCGHATLGTKQGEQVESAFKARAEARSGKKEEGQSRAPQAIRKSHMSKQSVIKKSKLQRKINYFVKRKYIRFFRFFGLLRTIKKAKKTNPQLAKVLFWCFVAIFAIGEKPLWVPPVIKGMTTKVKEARERKRDSASAFSLLADDTGESRKISEQTVNDLIPITASDQPGKRLHPPLYSKSVLPSVENAFFAAA